MKFKNFLDTITASDLSDDEKVIVDNLEKLSHPESIGSRQEYHEVMESVFDGEDPSQYHDKQAVEDMINTSIDAPSLPGYAANIIKNDREAIAERAFQTAEELHNIPFALGVQDAIYAETQCAVPLHDITSAYEKTTKETAVIDKLESNYEASTDTEDYDESEYGDYSDSYSDDYDDDEYED